MRLLLDTHAFLWFISGDARLPAGWHDLVRDPANEVYLSAASVWEAVVKQQLGKLPLPEPAAAYLPRQRERHRIAPLAMDEATVAQLPRLPALHRDPFDRILICQALQHDLALVTADSAVRAYPVKLADGT
jgi:PIN domain nuclease of toxin-antitoxin system